MKDKQIIGQFTVTVFNDGTSHFMVSFTADEKTVAFVSGVRDMVDELWPETDESDGKEPKL